MNHRRWWLAGIAVVAIAGGGYAAVHWQRSVERQRILDDLIARISLPPESDPSARFDAVRSFVHTNSQAKMDAEFYATWRDSGEMLRRFHDTVTGKRRDKVHVECSVRSTFMHMILGRLGYRTRSVWVYAPSQDLNSHTFLDAFNPRTRRWESHDPSYDVVWRNRATGARTAIVRDGGDLGMIEPCDNAGCGWNRARRDAGSIKNRADKYFEIVAVADREAGKRYSVYTARADVARPGTVKGKSGPYCEVVAKNCRDGLFPIGGPGPHQED